MKIIFNKENGHVENYEIQSVIEMNAAQVKLELLISLIGAKNAIIRMSGEEITPELLDELIEHYKYHVAEAKKLKKELRDGIQPK